MTTEQAWGEESALVHKAPDFFCVEGDDRVMGITLRDESVTITKDHLGVGQLGEETTKTES